MLSTVEVAPFPTDLMRKQIGIRAGQIIRSFISSPEAKGRSFYRQWGTAIAEKVERRLLPEDIKQIWQRNLRLWETQDQSIFEEKVGKWMDEIREGDGVGNPELQALRGDTGEKPHVSIVIPTHNEERYILRALQSLAAQRYGKSVEVLIVDNNSDPTDRTAVFTEQCGEKSFNIPLLMILLIDRLPRLH